MRRALHLALGAGAQIGDSAPMSPNPAFAAADALRDDPRKGLVQVILDLAASAEDDGLRVGDMVDRLDERAFGLSILIMAIPCLVPGLYGPPQIAAPIIALLAAQMLVGRREPYLPGFLRERRIPKAWLQAMAGFADKRLRWIDKIARPRLTWAATGLAERIAALAMILAAICIFPPITNTIPSLGLALLATGLLARDGLFVALGMVVTIGWASLLGIILIGSLFGIGFAAEWASEHLGALLGESKPPPQSPAP